MKWNESKYMFLTIWLVKNKITWMNEPREDQQNVVSASFGPKGSIHPETRTWGWWFKYEIRSNDQKDILDNYIMEKALELTYEPNLL